MTHGLRALGGLALGLAWLFLLTAYTRFAFPASLGFVVALLLLFLSLHAWRRWPRGWDYGRLRSFQTAHLAPALATLLLLNVTQIGLFVLFGSPDTTPEGAQPWWLLPLVAVVAAPLIEEFGIRLWLQSPLEAMIHPVAAVAVSTAIFTAIHGSELWYSHALSGVLYGAALIISGSIWLPILLHAVSNALIALLAQSADLTEVLRHWMQTDGPLAYVIVALLAAATAICGYRWYRTAPSLRQSR